jgi:hypothetical protein
MKPTINLFYKTSLLSYVMLFIFCLSTTSLWAQKLSIKTYAGYHLAQNPNNSFNQTTFERATGGTDMQYSVGKVRWTSGIAAGIGFNYQLKPFLALELGAQYLHGAKSELYNKRVVENVGEANLIYTYYTRMVFLNPSLVLSLPQTKYTPYARVGLVLGFGNYQRELEDASNLNGGVSNIVLQTAKVYGGMATGYQAALGVRCSIKKSWSVFGEWQFQMINYAPKRSEITSYTINGNNALGGLSTRQRETEFVKNLDFPSDGFGTFNENEPTKSLAYSLPFSNMGLQVGVCYSF